jgi:dipeptidyl aminopeptidase/acylaminoacyl peptidase
VVLVSGPDFVGSPARHGATLAWTQWDHPNMPWDETSLWVATIDRAEDGTPTGLSAERLVAGGSGESIVQPIWAPDGTLLFSTDRSGWWNPHRFDGASVTPLITSIVGGDEDRGPEDDDGVARATSDGVHAEIGGPAWVFGLRWIAPLASGRVACSITRDGLTGLAVIEPDGRLVDVPSPYTSVDQVVAGPDRTGAAETVVLVAASPVREAAPIQWTIEPTDPAAGDDTASLDALQSPALETLRPARDLGVGTEWFASPEPISFASAGGRTAHALYFAPTNPDVEPVAGDRPPLLVLSHGGPTSAARARLDLSRQYWTSRGFAVVDVNYGGSTGYGRAYRQELDGQWGIVDVEDCVAAAEHLAAEGHADGERLAIRGGSAGGYTTLAALTFHDAFAAGASHYGIADLGALARDTHKFESRYLDGLVGPYPEAKDVYEARSPIEHTDRLSCTLIVFQGLEDQVVPPNQAEMMIAALAAKGVPHAYVPFEGEQHGFRKAENIVRALEAELWFYGRVFGFDPADQIEPVPGAVGLD